jgi:hypothetical protein
MKTLRKISKDDLYSGIIVASVQNPDHLYELSIESESESDYLRYRAIAIVREGGIIEKKEDGSWFVLYQGFETNIWIETEESRKLDPVSVREDRLKEIGI